MIANITLGAGGHGVLRYLFYGDKQGGALRGSLIAGNCEGHAPRQLVKPFGAFRNLRPGLRKAIAHYSLSLPPDDREVSDDEFARIGAQFLEAMGHDLDMPWVAISHHDTAHAHIHLVALRITRNGEAVSDKQNYRRAQTICARLESAHGLRPVPERHQKPQATTKEKRMDEEIKHEPEAIHQPPEESADPPETDSVAEDSRQCAIVRIDSHENPASFGQRTDAALYRADLYRKFDDIESIRRLSKRQNIFFKDGKRIDDTADRLAAGLAGDATTAERVISMAILKWWSAVSFTGNNAFVRHAMHLALLRGLTVLPRNASQARMLAEVRGAQSLTVAPTPPNPLGAEGIREKLRAVREEEEPARRRRGGGQSFRRA